MSFTLLLAGAVLTGSSLSAADQKLLMRIHNATSRLSDKKSAFLHFNAEVTQADAQRCRMLQSRVPANSATYVELGFVQAYYGLDYDANLRRVLRPYHLWRTDINRWKKEYAHADPNSWAELDSVPDILNFLYLRHHDLRSLGAWLDLGLDGGPAEINDDTLGELWTRHKRAMLLACDGHPNRIANLAGSLMFHNVLNDKEASAYTRSKRRFADSLEPLIHSPDPHIARPAKALAKQILHNHLWETHS